MFGFKRKARTRAAEEAAELAAVRKAAHSCLITELRDTVDWLIAFHNLGGCADQILYKAEGIRKGIDAVLIDELDAFGPEMESQDNLVRGGAMTANAVRNRLFLFDTFDKARTRGDFCHFLGFTRDGLG